MSFWTTFIFKSNRAFRKQKCLHKSIVFVNVRPWAFYPENIKVQIQTPTFQGGVCAWTAQFSMATVDTYGGKRVKVTLTVKYGPDTYFPPRRDVIFGNIIRNKVVFREIPPPPLCLDKKASR